MEMYTKLKFYKVALVIVGLLGCQTAVAQFAPGFEGYRKQFPNAHSVRLQQITEVGISLVDGEIEITQKVIEEDLYLDESATQNSSRSVSFSSFFEMESLEASSFIYDGNKYRELEVEEFTEKDEMGESFHDDIRSINFIYPELAN